MPLRQKTPIVFAMSKLIVCIAPDSSRLHLLQSAVAVLGMDSQSADSLDELPDTPALILFWSEGNGSMFTPPTPTILISSQDYPIENNDYFSVLTRPLRVGAVTDQIRRFFKSGPAFSIPAEITFGDALFRPRESSFIVKEATDPIFLTEKERDILITLYKAGEKGLPRDQLLAQVWAYVQGVETHTLETHIYRLRQKIEADPSKPTFLVNEDNQYKITCFSIG